eukprot:TRINITY_DN5814_c0_g1_i1.p2 TRINITY_DN5814_c0_g1~~TRINITY_DN5814_c0_g1_i1.p2  ORF type:complete len:389 (+),score=66.97 TRINITY_DN5814_c0_g1_i1:1644-2810(+)
MAAYGPAQLVIAADDLMVLDAPFLIEVVPAENVRLPESIQAMNATTNAPLRGVSVLLSRAGVALDGETPLARLMTGMDGTVSLKGFSLPDGEYELALSAPGFSADPPQQFVVYKQELRAAAGVFFLNPQNLARGDLRVVLAWGARPFDLDAHLITPYGEHIYFGRRESFNKKVVLDVDVRNGFGPETITFHLASPGQKLNPNAPEFLAYQQQPGDGCYHFFVENFSHKGNHADAVPLSKSGASVAVYDDTGRILHLHVPEQEVDGGMWWDVFRINAETNEITLANCIVAQDMRPLPDHTRRAPATQPSQLSTTPSYAGLQRSMSSALPSMSITQTANPLWGFSSVAPPTSFPLSSPFQTAPPVAPQRMLYRQASFGAPSTSFTTTWLS